MKFLIDAQLPKRLAEYFSTKGYTAIHTLDLSDKNRTSDTMIRQLASEENYIIISKDADFLYSYILSGQPRKLILIKTGNTSNDKLIELFERNWRRILSSITHFSLVEIHLEKIIVHGE